MGYTPEHRKNPPLSRKAEGMAVRHDGGLSTSGDLNVVKNIGIHVTQDFISTDQVADAAKKAASELFTPTSAL